ncbi:MAG: hypothetical protein C4316_12080 [Chloroflexota bacterium]
MRTKVYLLFLAVGILVLSSRTGQAEIRPQPPKPLAPTQGLQTQVGFRVYLPAVFYVQPACDPISGQQYEAIPIDGPPTTNPPAEQHPDINALAVRGYLLTDAPKTLVDYGGGTDPAAPQLYTLFGDNRVPAFPNAYQVYDWNWQTNSRGGLITTWPVTLLGMGTARGEPLRLPSRNGPDIYQGSYWALVLYASTERITFVYTRRDTVADGYTIHVEGICVEPGLLNLYRQQNAAGRNLLPALKWQQPFGRANGTEIKVAIRDMGTFMDPRSRKDWWHGR